jgi:hypothetical protein
MGWMGWLIAIYCMILLMAGVIVVLGVVVLQRR